MIQVCKTLIRVILNFVIVPLVSRHDASGKQVKQARQGTGKNQPKPASFIDIANLDDVNASVDAMRASLLGSATSEVTTAAKHPAVQMLYHVAHAGHEVSVAEATQLYELAKTLEVFLSGLAPIGRNLKR